jgi:RimJ/RimL family protein N-acetyltransferase
MAASAEFRRFVPADSDLLVEFLTGEEWPYFAGGPGPDAARIREQVAAGGYDNDRTRRFWIGTGSCAEAGLIGLFDLGDSTPLFDLRVRAAYQRRGLGTAAVRWLTGYLFTEFSETVRIEGVTRQDNHAMRRTFIRCGYVKEAHWRQAWAGRDGKLYDSIGYAILRGDWETGTVTQPDWDDEPR